MSIFVWISLGLASVLAGAINAVAGGGTLITFPAALAAGLSPICANATNAVALVPGTFASALAYRRELLSDRRWLWPLLIPSVIGGLLGAFLVLAAPPRVFETVVPWLVFGATLLILLRGPLMKRLGASGPPTKLRFALVGLGILMMGIYGGYFGAGIGIITLATLSLLMPMDIHTMNARKTLLSGIVNGSAAGLFIVNGTVNPTAAGVMALGTITGGYFGARLARRVPARYVSYLVVAIGFLLSILLFCRGVGL
jgi:uncharacterized membrane protein YfcA